MNMEPRLCPACQQEIDVTTEKCYHCGQELNVPLEDPRVFYIQNNVETYLRKFTRLEEKNSKIGWNWCGFFLSPSWMLYRKMYGLWAFFFFAPDLVKLVLSLISPTEDFAIGLSLIFSLIFLFTPAMYGDYWYKQKIEKLVNEGSSLSEEEKINHYKKGGTNFVLVLILFFVGLALNFLLA